METFDCIKPKYTPDEIIAFQNEHSFMDGYVELLKQTIELLYRMIGFRYCDTNGNPNHISKDEAILGGNLTRLIKLNTSLLQNVCEHKLEICFILNRCIAETYVNCKYLLVEGEEKVYRNYIKYSLITEKELWNTITANIKARDGETFDIENRMQQSIRNSFEQSDFDMDDVSRSSKWKSIKSRADLVADEMFYSVFYGIASHSIHGNWQDILYNHLKKSEDRFTLNLEWQRPRPQIMDGAITLNLDLVAIFVEKELNGNHSAAFLKETSETLLSYYTVLTENHEKWLLSKSVK